MENRIPVPICATVSRATGEIRFEYSDREEDLVRFGRVMNRISRIAETYMDRKVKAGPEAMSGAAKAEYRKEMNVL